MLDRSYFIYEDKFRFLPDGSKFYDVVKYRDLYHKPYFKSHRWVAKYNKPVTYSNDQRLSLIKNLLPEEYHDLFLKGRLYDIFRDKKYIPKYYNFNITDENFIEGLLDYLEQQDGSPGPHRGSDTLMFLKKTSHLTYGGYDVMPFHNRGERSLEEILEFIEANNKHPKYRSDEFTIQQGIERILLTPENKKFDLRTYGLVVWEVGDIEDVGDQSRDGSRDAGLTVPVFQFYYFQYMLMRKCTKEYDPDSDDPKKQLTNTTQNRGEDLYGITELIDPSYEWYDSIYYQTMDVFKDVAGYIKGRSIGRDLPTKGYHLIGLDFLPDENYQVYLLEINKHPAIYYDPELVKALHHNMESKMMTESYFRTILERGHINDTPENFNKIIPS